MHLAPLCSNYPYFVSGKRKGTNTFGLAFDTRVLPCITELHKFFYPNNVKVIPKNIYDLLTPIALAHLIAGDGSHVNGGVVICTDSFSIQDVVLLVNVLIIRYDLNCKV